LVQQGGCEREALTVGDDAFAAAVQNQLLPRARRHNLPSFREHLEKNQKLAALRCSPTLGSNQNPIAISSHIHIFRLLLYVKRVSKMHVDVFFFENVSASMSIYSFITITTVKIARSRLFIASTKQRRWRVL
jgi:hypothetical protein